MKANHLKGNFMKVSKIWILAVVIAVFVNGCEKKTPKQKEEMTAQKSANKFQHLPQVRELCSKYNAVTDWKQPLGKRGFMGHTYTIEVEDTLIGIEGRPILFYGTINDIVKESDKYLVYFAFGFAATLRDISSIVAGYNVFFVLECTPEQVEHIINLPAEMYDEYAVIAQISKVEKVEKFRFESAEDARVYLALSDVFRAKGKCLDLFFVAGKQKDEQKQ